MLLIEDLDKEKNTRTNEIIALFAQYFFDYFNSLNKSRKIFWHGKCFSINNDKIKSYVKFRSKIIKNVMMTYFLKTKGIHNIGNIKLEEKEKKCIKFLDYKVLKNIQDGILYFDGQKIDLLKFYNGNIKIINEEIKEEMFLDLFDFE